MWMPSSMASAISRCELRPSGIGAASRGQLLGALKDIAAVGQFRQHDKLAPFASSLPDALLHRREVLFHLADDRLELHAGDREVRTGRSSRAMSKLVSKAKSPWRGGDPQAKGYIAMCERGLPAAEQSCSSDRRCTDAAGSSSATVSRRTFRRRPVRRSVARTALDCLQPEGLHRLLAEMMLSATETIATRFEVAWSLMSL